MGALAIRIEGLAKDFGAVRAVDELTLEVPSGVVFGFLGPNGAGKTTTIRLLLGLLEPTAGQAEVLGYDTRTQGQHIRARTGALLEDPGVYGELTAEDNLEFYGRVARMEQEERRSRIEELLRGMSLWERRRERASTWSRGMRQKLAIARALLHRPALIFLDEPTAGLDVMAAQAVREDVATLARQEGVTVFLTTHNMTEAERLCQRVAVIRQGLLVAVGDPDDLRARAGGERVAVFGRGLDERVADLLRARPEVVGSELQNEHLVIDLQPRAETAPLVGLLVSEGVQVEEVRRGKASLEEVFLTLMEEER